jgi:hypothetical protein
MAKQLPEQFETLLKEELTKIKKESVKESVKDTTKEPVNEGKKTDGDKESLNEMEEIDLSELSLEDIEEAYNEASSSDEFEISPDEINIDDVEKELEEMAAGVDSMQQEGDNPSDPFDQIKNLHKMLGEMIQDNEMNNEMHDKVPHGATAPASKGHNTTPVGIDEAIDPAALSAIGGALGVFAAGGGLAALQNWLKKNNPKVADALEKMGSSASSSIKGGTTSMGESEEMLDEAVDPAALSAIGGALGVLAAGGGLAMLQNWLKQNNPKVAAALEQMGSAAASGIKGGSTSMGEGEEIIDETAGSSKGQAANRTVGNENMPTSSPRKDSTQREYQKESVKKWSDESVQKFMTQKETMEKRMNSLINENKKMTKKLNDSKVDSKKFQQISEEHAKIKQTLVKYRDQLSEMAIFNTNLAGVNSILVNENLALTSEDKKAIINKFKNVKTIKESEETYKSVLNEMQSAKKTITESVEDKVTVTVDKSASEKVVEQTAYVNEHVNKIKNMMKYVDDHGNKKILSTR